MKEIKHKSIIPVYSVAIVWCLYCFLFPLYKTWHFLALACSAVVAYFALSSIFPGKIEYVEEPDEPVRTGDGLIDALLEEGEAVVAELRGLNTSIENVAVNGKFAEIIAVVEKIFRDLIDDPGDYKQVKRFSQFYLPTTVKLMDAYDRFLKTDARGVNISGTLDRIESSLDLILDSYTRFFDSLFENQALDIETDIRVLENLLKEEKFVV